MRVLVAEDEVKLADRIASRLSAAGFVVDVANEGKQAQFLGATEPYDAERDSNVLDVLVSRIRRKIGPTLISTVRGRGFMLADTVSD